MTTVQQLLRTKGSQVISISPEATVYEALWVMGEHNIGALVVLENGRLVGIISERDYARKIILKAKLSRETFVREIMTPNPITVRPLDNIETCMQLMTERRVRHLPVMEDADLLGIISIGDVVKEMIEQQAFLIEQLERYISGQMYVDPGTMS